MLFTAATLFLSLSQPVNAKATGGSFAPMLKKMINRAAGDDFLQGLDQLPRAAVDEHAAKHHALALGDEENPHTDDEYRARNVFKVSCPAIGTLYKKGFLMPDKEGRVTNFQISSALYNKLDLSYTFAQFQGIGIAGYDDADKNQLRRDRSPVSSRYLNIFRMHPGDFIRSDNVQHGFSTTIHDARFDPEAPASTLYSQRNWAHPEYYLEDMTDEKYQKAVRDSREKRMKEKYFPLAKWEEVNGEKRMYAEGLAVFLAGVKKVGDYSGEWAVKHYPSNDTFEENSNMFKFHPITVQKKFENVDGYHAMTEWQALGAWSTFLGVIGRVDEDRKKKEDPDNKNAIAGLYMTEKDLLAAFLDYEFLTFNENKDWKYNRYIGLREVQAQLLEFNEYTKDSVETGDMVECYELDKCVFAWVSAIKLRGVVKEGSWWTADEARTTASFLSLMNEFGINDDGLN